MVDVAADEREAAGARAPDRREPRPARLPTRSTRRSRRRTASAKVAIVSLLAGVDAETARARLARRRTATSGRRSPMRLGVEAALVDGTARPGRRRDRRRPHRPRRPRARTAAASPRPASSTSRSTGSAASTSSTRTPTATAGPARRCSRPASPPTSPPSSRRRRSSCSPRVDEVPLDGGGPRILGVHLEGPFLAPGRLGTHPPPGAPRSGSAPARAAARVGPVRLMTLAPELDGADCADRPPAPARRHGLVRAHGRDRGRGERGVRPRRPNRHAPLQRDAPVPAPRPGHRGRRARPGRRRRPDHPRRRPPRARDRQARLAGRRGRVALVTDAVSGAGVQDGSYSLGGVEVKIRDGVARGPDGAARRQRADDDRGRPQPARARRAAAPTRSKRPRRCPPACSALPTLGRLDARRARPTSSSSTTTSRSSASSSGGRTRVAA